MCYARIGINSIIQKNSIYKTTSWQVKIIIEVKARLSNCLLENVKNAEEQYGSLHFEIYLKYFEAVPLGVSCRTASKKIKKITFG